MDELSRYSAGTVLNPDDLHPVIRDKDVETAKIAEKLMKIADEARKFSYSPYSKFSVGAALLCMDGTIYTGCNIETAAFTGVCAERNAVFKAISDGRKSFAAIAISGGKHEKESGYCSPCGVCRQVLSEFVNPFEFMVIFRGVTGDVKAVSFNEVLPYSFGPESLE